MKNQYEATNRTPEQCLADMGIPPEQIERIKGQCMNTGHSLWDAVKIIQDAIEQDKAARQWAEIGRQVAAREATERRSRAGKYSPRRFPIPR